MNILKKFKDTLISKHRYFTTFALIGGAISDIVQPIAPFSLYFLFFFITACLVLFFLRKKNIFFNDYFNYSIIGCTSKTYDINTKENAIPSWYMQDKSSSDKIYSKGIMVCKLDYRMHYLFVRQLHRMQLHYDKMPMLIHEDHPYCAL